MADNTTSSDAASAPSNEITINVKGPSELKLSLTIATDKTVLELKQAIAEKSGVEASSQRLIYSGKVLKDDDPLSQYKIASGHTLHMVKGAARSGGGAASASTSSSAPAASTGTAGRASEAAGIPSSFGAGQNWNNNPLAQLNSHMGFGLGNFNPFTGMGLNPNDPNMAMNMFSNPEFLTQMRSMLANPMVIDQIIALNPQLQAMGPQVREMMRSEQFREFITNPESMRRMMELQRTMGGEGGMQGMQGMQGMGGLGPMAGLFGAPPPSFNAAAGGTPATSAPSSTTPSSTSQSPQSSTGQSHQVPAFNPFALLGAMGAPPASSPGGTAGAEGTGGVEGAGGGVPTNPYGMNPELMQQLLGGMGPFGGGLGGGPFGGAGTPAQPQDSRSPEERYQTQLQQLSDMGFTDASENVRALIASGGNVNGAVEYILGRRAGM